MNESYSDHILALRPWCYIKFNEPLGHNIYLDSSGNRNHFLSGSYQTPTPKGVNQVTIDFSGDPYSSVGVLLNSPITPLSLPSLRSEAGNTLSVKSILGILTLKPLNLTENSDIIRWGNIYVSLNANILETKVLCYNQLGSPYLNSVFSQLFTDTSTRRVGFGIKLLSSNSFNFYAIIDDILTFSVITLPMEHYIDLQSYYSSIQIGASTPRLVVSNHAVFYNRESPTPQWVIKSWEAHTRSYTPFHRTTMQKIFSNSGGYPLQSIQGSTINLLDSILLNGDNHHYVNSFNCTGTTVEAVIKPLQGTNVSYHSFNRGDTVSVRGSGYTELDGDWVIDQISQNSVTFEVQSIVSSVVPEYCIIKRSVIGEWKRISSGSKVSYESLNSLSLSTRLVVDDINQDYTILSVTDRNSSNQSNTLFLKKNLKSSINQEINSVRWGAVGDDRRFYIFIANRQLSPSHSQLICFGDIKDLSDDQWYTILVAYKDSSIGNVGSNLAFSYSQWTILPSGHLLCQLTTQPDSDTRWVKTRNNSHTYLWGYGDVGHHVYPIPIPHTEYS